MSNVIHGKDIRIYNSGGSAALLAGAKSCTIHKQCDVIEKASSSNATEKEFIAGRTSWTVDLSHLIISGTESIPLVGTEYGITVMVNGSQSMSGTVICTLADIQATAGNLATGSIKMQGTGPLAAVSNNSPS